MRTGAEYRQALRDGRRVWVMGEGLVEDVTTHPATRAMVDEYVAWYDLHLDPAWQEIAIRPPDAESERIPWAYVVPKSADDLAGMGRFFSATTFLSAGNITHTPCYGHMIALGVQASVEERNVSPEQIANAARYREMIARTGHFLTFCGGAPTIGARMREDPAERTALKLVRETDGGIVIRGKIGMHTSPAFAEDVYVGSLCGIEVDGHRATFIVPVNAPGVTTVCRKIAVRDENPFVAPLSSRYDELDGQMWLDDVFIPWERVFLLGESPEPVVRWLIWHHLYGWLSKAEFTLGPGARSDPCDGAGKARPDDRAPGRFGDRGADRAQLPHRLRARPAVHRNGLLRSQPRPPCGRRHRDIEGAAAHGRDPAHRARLVAGGLPVGQGSRRARGRRRLSGFFRRRRLYGIAALGLAADGVGPRLVGARRPRIRLRIARQRRHPGVARPAAPQFRAL